MCVCGATFHYRYRTFSISQCTVLVELAQCTPTVEARCRGIPIPINIEEFIAEDRQYQYQCFGGSGLFLRAYKNKLK